MVVDVVLSSSVSNSDTSPSSLEALYECGTTVLSSSSFIPSSLTFAKMTKLFGETVADSVSTDCTIRTGEIGCPLRETSVH